jgi:hypothetical protein
MLLKSFQYGFEAESKEIPRESGDVECRMWDVGCGNKVVVGGVYVWRGKTMCWRESSSLLRAITSKGKRPRRRKI